MDDKQCRDLAAMSIAGHFATTWKMPMSQAEMRRIADWSFDLAEALVEERGKRDRTKTPSAQKNDA